MSANGHTLVTGGPGSGKTTVAILKAADIAQTSLYSEQKILFLSFARATVARIIEAIEQEQKLPKEQRKRISVETYHSFFWRIIKTHGYLIGLPRRLSVLTPPNEAIALSLIRNLYPTESKLPAEQKTEKEKAEFSELMRLAKEEGQICFDMFAQFSAQILIGSERIRRLTSMRYPFIILDEFQDTNSKQWQVVQNLGEASKLIALADPEQRIYDCFGADPERLNHFRNHFFPTVVDFSSDNHRSAGTDIAAFGNDIVKGKFRQGKDAYNGIKRIKYRANKNHAWVDLLTATYNARSRLSNGKKNWSLAILVPTKKMTRQVSDAFNSPPGKLTRINHTSILDIEATVLSAELIAFLLQQQNETQTIEDFFKLLCNYFEGRGGMTPTKSDIKEAASIKAGYQELLKRKSQGKGIRTNSILVPMIAVYESTKTAKLSGIPKEDWLSIRRLLESGHCNRLKKIADDVRNLRLLERGNQLREALSQDWRDYGCYANALEITRQAFVKEHFSTTNKPESGVIVMNMHKAKGKQFDEVIIFEGWPKKMRGKILGNPDRIVWSNSPKNDNDQARYNLRVSVTRGKERTTILTPMSDPCILLLNRN